MTTPSQTVVGVVPKDPEDMKQFYMDWSAVLGTDTIVASTWTVPSEVTVENSSILTGGRITSVLLSGGVARVNYLITNTVTFASGQIRQRTGLLSVRQN